MGTSSKDGIGKDPEEVDAAAPTDEQVLEHLEQQATPEAAADDLDQELPSRAELFQVVQEQQERIERLEDRVADLEAEVDDVSFEATTIEEVAEQFRKGEIGGDAGAEFLQKFVSVPPSDSLINARSNQLFFRIIRERRVGKPVLSKHVVNWLDFHDSANPSVKAKRVMERVEQHRDDDHYIGSIELGKYRGQNCIWLNRD